MLSLFKTDVRVQGGSGILIKKLQVRLVSQTVNSLEYLFIRTIIKSSYVLNSYAEMSYELAHL